MRIISGYLKGKKIDHSSSKFTRPLKDITKESIFNILQHSNLINFTFEKSKVLDLFSGTGSFGIECLSRGARHVDFIENYKQILPILKKNLSSLKLLSNYTIIEKDILNNFNFSEIGKKFDIIFLDPPYKEKNIENLLYNISKYKLLKIKGIVIIHRHKNQENNFSESLKIIDEKKYGISKIIFGKFI